jgi:hypothetical protein
MLKGLGTFLLLMVTLVHADLITTFDFDIEESEFLSYTRPGWNNEGTVDDTFYYNLVSFTVDTGGDWRAANNSITSHDSFNYTNEQALQQNGPLYAADTFIYLYDIVFVPTNPSLNLIAQNDDGYDGGNGYQFDLTYNLKKDVPYMALITTYDPEEEIGGTVEIYGPQGSSINMAIIPEPRTYALLIAFLGFMTIAIRRRKNWT